MSHNYSHIFLVLTLTLTITTTTISAVELGGYPSDEWEDVISSLSVFNNEEMYENNEQQRTPSCWACTFVTNQILAGWTKHAYKLKKWSEEKKTKKAEKALNKACKRITKQQICLTSDKGFQDFNVLMQSGVISGLNMDSKFGLHLLSFCKALVPRLIEHGIAERMSDVIKLFDYNLQRDVCEEIVRGACPKRKSKEERKRLKEEKKKEKKKKKEEEKKEEEKKEKEKKERNKSGEENREEVEEVEVLDDDSTTSSSSMNDDDTIEL